VSSHKMMSLRATGMAMDRRPLKNVSLVIPCAVSSSADNGSLDKRDRAKFEDLHRSIRACDDVLNSVETNLTSFRNDLSLVSADIETLQARSTALNLRLENRKAVERGLGPIVEELSVSPAVVSKIAEGHIDEHWVQALKEVDRRAASYRNNPAQKQGKALADLGPLLEKLLQKVMFSCRTFGSGLTSPRPLSGYATSWLPKSRQ